MRMEHGMEDHEAIGRAHKRLGGAFGVRHHAHDVAAGVEDAGDVAQRAVGIGGSGGLRKPTLVLWDIVGVY